MTSFPALLGDEGLGEGGAGNRMDFHALFQTGLEVYENFQVSSLICMLVTHPLVHV